MIFMKVFWVRMVCWIEWSIRLLQATRRLGHCSRIWRVFMLFVRNILTSQFELILFKLLKLSWGRKEAVIRGLRGLEGPKRIQEVGSLAICWKRFDWEWKAVLRFQKSEKVFLREKYLRSLCHSLWIRISVCLTVVSGLEVWTGLWNLGQPCHKDSSVFIGHVETGIWLEDSLS